MFNLSSRPTQITLGVAAVIVIALIAFNASPRSAANPRGLQDLAGLTPTVTATLEPMVAPTMTMAPSPSPEPSATKIAEIKAKIENGVLKVGGDDYQKIDSPGAPTSFRLYNKGSQGFAILDGIEGDPIIKDGKVFVNGVLVGIHYDGKTQILRNDASGFFTVDKSTAQVVDKITFDKVVSPSATLKAPVATPTTGAPVVAASPTLESPVDNTVRGLSPFDTGDKIVAKNGGTFLLIEKDSSRTGVTLSTGDSLTDTGQSVVHRNSAGVFIYEYKTNFEKIWPQGNALGERITTQPTPSKAVVAAPTQVAVNTQGAEVKATPAEAVDPRLSPWMIVDKNSGIGWQVSDDSDPNRIVFKSDLLTLDKAKKYYADLVNYKGTGDQIYDPRTPQFEKGKIYYRIIANKNEPVAIFEITIK